MNKEQMGILFAWLLTKKCPKCGSKNKKSVTFEINELGLGEISAECKHRKKNGDVCGNQWQLENILVEED